MQNKMQAGDPERWPMKQNQNIQQNFPTCARGPANTRMCWWLLLHDWNSFGWWMDGASHETASF